MSSYNASISAQLLAESGDVPIVLRKPTVKDVPAMAGIINAYAAQGQMLPRSLHKLYQSLRDFMVVEVDGHVIACGALAVLWEDLAEIRSLAVANDWRRKGLGRIMVQYFLQEARGLGLDRVFALTYQPGFFERLGFRMVPRDSLPQKVWGECLDCTKFPNCDEVALVLDLETQTQSAEERG